MAAGAELLLQEDPVHALATYRDAARGGLEALEVPIGLGRSHLLLGWPEIALRYARDARRVDPEHDAASALEIRALLRARRFREALERSERASAAEPAGIEVLAAYASALFRAQRNEEAERAYRRVLELDPLHAEAHLRLGSGLTPPREVEIGARLERGVAAARDGRLEAAIAAFVDALAGDPGNPVAHRLLGEALFARLGRASMASRSAEFRELAARLPVPSLDGLPVETFVPAWAELDPARRAVAARALGLFASRLPRLVAMGGRHDLLGATERTTDDPARANLRGRRTFDGRVWDDVRGIGGLRAATGIEALDEALDLGFDTLAHEIAHQAHLYAFPRALRVRIRRLYETALEEGRCLDFYAASNDAEYFGQGVEAFACLGKRPGYEVTHGHTRFELMRVDPDLHDFIAGVVDHDPLDPARVSAAQRGEILCAAIAAALRSGRFADAVTAAELLPSGPEREVVLRAARRASRLTRSY